MVGRLIRIARRLRSRDNESGFTLVELMVAIVSGMVVSIAALTWLVVSINQQNAISSRSLAASQAEAGLQQFTQDLRNAMYESPISPTTFYTVTVTTNAAAATTSVTFDIPNPTNGDIAEQVAWTCPTTAATGVQSCSRAVTTSGGTATTTPITGVKSAVFDLTESNGTTGAVGTTGGTTVYPNGTTPRIASIAITLNIYDISQLDPSQTQVVPGVQNTIPIQTIAELRNFA